MANRHIKIINGREYYYQSIRRGKKVTSKYLGPVDNKRRRMKDELSQTQSQSQDLTYIG